MSLLAVGASAFLLSAAFLPPPHCLAHPRASTCSVTMKLNKQQQLALLMEQAERQRQGLPPTEEAVPQKAATSAQKKKAKAAPRTREELGAVMKKIKDSNPDEMASKTQSHLKYGVSVRPAAAASKAKPAATKSASAAGKPISDAGYTYSEFQQLLKGDGKTSRAERPLSDNLLQRGTSLPMPPNLPSLDGTPNSFASLEALADGQSTLVVLASSDSYLSERLRQVLVTFHGRLRPAQSGASMMCVCRAPLSSLRKLARKANVAMPLLSDPDGSWTSRLKCDPAGGVSAFLVDVESSTVLASFSDQNVAAETLVQTIDSALKRKDELYGAPAEKSASAELEEAVAMGGDTWDDVPDGDEMPEEWAELFRGAEAIPTPMPPPPPPTRAPPQKAPPAPPTVQPPTPPPSVVVPKPEVTFRPTNSPLSPPPAPAGSASSPSASALEAENEALRAKLAEVKAREEARELQEAAARMQKENEKLRKQLEAENARRKAAEAKKAEMAAKARDAAEAKKAKQKAAREEAARAAEAAKARRAETDARAQQLAEQQAALEAEARRDAEEAAKAEAAAAAAARRQERRAAQEAVEAAVAAAAAAPPAQADPPASEGSSATERAGEVLPAALPLEQLQAVHDENATPASLRDLCKGRSRLVLLFGRLGSPALAEALRLFEYGFSPRADDANIDATVVALGVGDAPAVFTLALKRAADHLSFDVLLDRESALLTSLGLAPRSDGLAVAVVGGFDESRRPSLIGAFDASGSGSSELALRSTVELLEQSRPAASSKAAGSPASDDPALDPNLARQWQSLLQTLEGRRDGAPERGGRGELPRGRVEASWGPRSPTPERWSTGTEATPERPLGVWLPGLKRVSKLLNGTAGVRRIASSKVHRVTSLGTSAARRDDETGSGEGASDNRGANDNRGGVVGGVSGVSERLVIRFDGQGNYGAHRLRAYFQNARGTRTQELYVSCDDSFSLAQLREVLRALQPVLDFVLDDGMGVPF